MPKGHSTLEPRIANLEKALQACADMCDIEFGKANDRIASLERRIAEMNEAFSNARFPRAPQQSYRSTDGSQVPS